VGEGRGQVGWLQKSNMATESTEGEVRMEGGATKICGGGKSGGSLAKQKGCWGDPRNIFLRKGLLFEKETTIQSFVGVYATKIGDKEGSRLRVRGEANDSQMAKKKRTEIM